MGIPTNLQIFVKDLDGTTLTFNVTSATTTEELKSLIFDKKNYPIIQQRIVYSGKELIDGQTLEDKNISNQSTLHMVIRLRGGMFHESSGR